jgi:hypothetical protein
MTRINSRSNSASAVNNNAAFNGFMAAAPQPQLAPTAEELTMREANKDKMLVTFMLNIGKKAPEEETIIARVHNGAIICSKPESDHDRSWLQFSLWTSGHGYTPIEVTANGSTKEIMPEDVWNRLFGDKVEERIHSMVVANLGSKEFGQSIYDAQGRLKISFWYDELKLQCKKIYKEQEILYFSIRPILLGTEAIEAGGVTIKKEFAAEMFGKAREVKKTIDSMEEMRERMDRLVAYSKDKNKDK